MTTRVDSRKQRSILGLLLPVFQYIPEIKKNQLSVVYRNFTGLKFYPRKFGFKNSTQVLKLNVFNHHGLGKRLVSLHEERLLDVLVRPLLSLQKPPDNYVLAFERANGFKANILCDYFKVENMSQLIDKCTVPAQQPSSSTHAPPSALPSSTPATPKSQAKLHPAPAPIQPGAISTKATSLPAHSVQSPVNRNPNQGVSSGGATAIPTPSSYSPVIHQGASSDGVTPPTPVLSSSPVNRYSNQGAGASSGVVASPIPVLSSRLPVKHSSNQGGILSPSLTYSTVNRYPNQGALVTSFSKFSSYFPVTNYPNLGVTSTGVSSLPVVPSHFSVNRFPNQGISLPTHFPIPSQGSSSGGMTSLPPQLSSYSPVPNQGASVTSIPPLFSPVPNQSASSGGKTTLPSQLSSHSPVPDQSASSGGMTTLPPQLSSHSPVPNRSASVTSIPLLSSSLVPNQGASSGVTATSLPSQLSSHSSVECHPNPGVPPGEEAFLPALTSVRPDMEVPILTTKPIFPSFSRRETKEELIKKLEACMQDHIVRLCRQRKHLSPEILATVANKAVAYANTKRKGKKVNKKNILCLSKFNTLYCRVNEFIRCFCWNTSITSLYELQKAILILEKCESFDDLQMGPILTHPLVKDFFKPPADLVSVPEITVYDIHKHLTSYIKDKKGTSYTLSAFLEYFAEQKFVPDAKYLCIRITCFHLALTVSHCL